MMPKTRRCIQNLQWCSSVRIESIELLKFEHKVKLLDSRKSSICKVEQCTSIPQSMFYAYIETGRPEEINSRCLQIQSIAAGSPMPAQSLRYVADWISWISARRLNMSQNARLFHTKQDRSHSHPTLSR